MSILMDEINAIEKNYEHLKYNERLSVLLFLSCSFRSSGAETIWMCLPSYILAKNNHQQQKQPQ